MSFTYNNNYGGPNRDPWGISQVWFPGFKNFLPRWTLKVLPHKYKSRVILLSSKIKCSPISRKSKLNLYTSNIQNLYWFCQLTMISKSLLKTGSETMVDIYIKFYFRLENFWLDYNFWNKYNCSGPPALIVKRVQLQSNQKLLHQYLHSKNSSISKFIPKIQQKSHGHLGIALGIFGHVHPKNHCLSF